MSDTRRSAAIASVAALLSSTRPRVVILTASILLAGVSLVGWGLGVGMVKRGYQTLRNSELLAGLLEKNAASFAREKWVMQGPQNMELFVNYLNALAPAVNNLEVLPGRQIDSFTIISNAAWQSGVELVDFALDDSDEMVLLISACAQDVEQVGVFINLLSKNKDFAELGAPAFHQQENSAIGQQFTITCAFSPLF